MQKIGRLPPPPLSPSRKRALICQWSSLLGVARQRAGRVERQPDELGAKCAPVGLCVCAWGPGGRGAVAPRLAADRAASGQRFINGLAVGDLPLTVGGGV